MRYWWGCSGCPDLCPLLHPHTLPPEAGRLLHPPPPIIPQTFPVHSCPRSHSLPPPSQLALPKQHWSHPPSRHTSDFSSSSPACGIHGLLASLTNKLMFSFECFLVLVFKFADLTLTDVSIAIGVVTFGLDYTGACCVYCIGRCQRKHDHWGWFVVTGSDLEEGEVGEVPGGSCVDHQCVWGGGDLKEGNFQKFLFSLFLFLMLSVSSGCLLALPSSSVAGVGLNSY